MLEDQEDDARLMDRLLTKEKIAFTRIRVSTRQDYVDALDIFGPDVILSDHALPQFNSIEALQVTREKKIEAPFIIVTGTVSEEFAVNCLKKGADDYVLKTNLSRLPSAISHALHQHHTNQVRKEQEDVLAKQNADLIKINKELDSFVYSISHNLRSPLASVIGLVNIAQLDRDKNAEAIERYFDMIKKSTFKLDEVLKDILNYSLNSRTELEISPVDLKELIRKSFDQLNYIRELSAPEMQMDIHAEAPLYADAHRLSIILTNLLSNAIKYADHKKEVQSISIKASVTVTDAAIDILDNGIGVHPAYLPNIFDMFYRANPKSEGAGLGLYIAKEVVEKLKGTVEITSEFGEWTNAKIRIPNMKK